MDNIKKYVSIGGIIIFLLQWIITDVLDHQTVFSPHEKLTNVIESVKGTTDTSVDDDSNVLNNSVEEETVLLTCRITSAAANIRSGAGKDKAIITSANSGDEYSASGETEKISGTTWYEIELGEDEKGWISEKVCEIDKVVIENKSRTDDDLSNDKDTSNGHDKKDLEEGSVNQLPVKGMVSTLTKTQFKDIFEPHAEEISSTSTNGRIPDDLLVSELPNIVKASKYSASYSTPSYLIKKALHILLCIILLVVLFYVFCFLILDHKFLGFLVIVGMIAYMCLFWRDNTVYNYKVDGKYELIESNMEDSGNYNISYYDGDEVTHVSVDSAKAQIIVLPQNDSVRYYYRLKKKTKNVWYFLTESKPRERVIYMIY